MTRAADVFETGRFNIILIEEPTPPEPEFYKTIEMIRKLEKKNGFEKSIILVMTEHHGKHSNKAIVNDYIFKPVTSDKLLNEIEKWTGQEKDKPNGKIPGYRKDNIFNLDAALDRAMDDKSFLEMLLNEFIKGLPDKLDVMKESVLQKNYKVLALQAHSLRGSALNIGADGITAAALELEKNTDVGDFEPINKNLKHLESEYQRFKLHINTINWGDV